MKNTSLKHRRELPGRVPGLSRISRLPLACDVLIVPLVAAIGLSLALQGWRSRPTDFDSVPHLNGAFELVEHGTLPNKGNLSGYASYTPPGPSWLIAPGVLLSTDPRLFEYVGSAIVYVGTLIGIFLLHVPTLGHAVRSYR